MRKQSLALTLAISAALAVSAGLTAQQTPPSASLSATDEARARAAFTLARDVISAAAASASFKAVALIPLCLVVIFAAIAVADRLRKAK